MSIPSPTILLVPGLRDHLKDDWQTHLQRHTWGARSVSPDELLRALR